MQKKLADYFKALMDQHDALIGEFYEDFALMVSDEAIIIMGLLMSLNVVDCNVCIKVMQILTRKK